MKSPLFILMSATALMVIGILCLLSYAGYEDQHQPPQPIQQKKRVISPAENINESERPAYELTRRNLQHQPTLSRGAS